MKKIIYGTCISCLDRLKHRKEREGNNFLEPTCTQSQQNHLLTHDFAKNYQDKIRKAFNAKLIFGSKIIKEKGKENTNLPT